MPVYEMLLGTKRDGTTWRCRLEWGRDHRVYGEGPSELEAIVDAMNAAKLHSDYPHFSETSFTA